MPNHLQNETSPYLLQHANNPVEWYPWVEEALARAVQEDKPILVSIGYSACHWCHVMERESFEDPVTAALMNEHFINIKIDREERPDLDHIYMDAVQAMTGSGGWPLNVFLTPDRKPFYGGTYFPPRRAFNRASWTETLTGLVQAFKERRHEVDAQAENLTAHILQSNSFGFQQSEQEEIFDVQQLHETIASLLRTADKQEGGFGKAPKFPQTFSISLLLQYGWAFPDHPQANAAIEQALLSLDKMIAGGINDQLGGGFARYATDAEWLVPHFEKMLYDNALLVSVMSEAYQFTRHTRYRQAIDATLAFVEREMMTEQYAFYAALDADSEGEEGKFYVWTSDEIEKLLGENAAIYCRYFDITPEGNWEGKSILRRKNDPEVIAKAFSISPERLQEVISEGSRILMEARSKRIRPGLDDKSILGWNALMNTAYSNAFMATGNEHYRDTAIRNMDFMLKTFLSSEGNYYHTWKKGEAKYTAFLDDYAYLLDALNNLQEATGDPNWLKEAAAIMQLVKENFEEEETGFFFFTSKQQTDVVVRKKEVYDGAVPSGNAMMVRQLHRLGLLLDQQQWMEQARGMVRSLGKAILKYPGSFGVWASMLMEMVTGTKELAIIGSESKEIAREVMAQYLPHRVMMRGEPNEEYPLLAGKQTGIRTAIYLCSNYTCQNPVFSAKELSTLIASGRKG